jgi:DNA-binding response OmpR family regulator
MRVLVVEDEEPLADAVARGLRRHGMNVDVAYDGDDGYGKLASLGYDVVVLDRDLPGMSGDDICVSIRTTGSPTRVLMLTASTSDAARAHGLALGAADYMTKPFVFNELVERVRALAN